MEELSIERLSRLIETDPVEFDIAILRGAEEEGDPFVLQEGHLGVNASDLARLARDFRRSYRKIRQDYGKELFGATEMSLDKNTAANIPQQELLKVTSCLLLLCPDNATAWADRKRALLTLTREPASDHFGIWNKELRFINLLMTRHTKAPTSWFHRKYVLQKLIILKVANVEGLIDLAQEEIRICSNVAEKYPKNYYAWTHRNYVLDKLHGICCGGESGSKEITYSLQSLLEDEWKSIQVWLRTHVSDHSAAHYGGCILRLQVKTLSHEGGTVLSLLSGAVENSRRLVGRYPTHEVLWIFRRICGHAFLTKIKEAIGPVGSESQIQESVAAFWKQEIVLLSDTTDENCHPNGTERVLEVTTAETFRLSYIAWLLELLKSLDLVYLGIQQEQLLTIREGVLGSLRKKEKTAMSLLIKYID